MAGKGRKPKEADDGKTDSRQTPLKCRRCAMMQTPEVKVLHGPSGDGCYDKTRCPSLRSYIRNREAINRKRRMQREDKLDPYFLQRTSLEEQHYAILVRYQGMAQDAPLHAIAVEIWQGMEPYGVVQLEIEQDDGTYRRYPGLHCLGLTPSQIYSYAVDFLKTLEPLGVKKYDAEKKLDPTLCPIRPCPLHPGLP